MGNYLLVETRDPLDAADVNASFQPGPTPGDVGPVLRGRHSLAQTARVATASLLTIGVVLALASIVMLFLPAAAALVRRDRTPTTPEPPRHPASGVGGDRGVELVAGRWGEPRGRPMVDLLVGFDSIPGDCAY